MIIYKIEENGQATNLQLSKTCPEGFQSMEGDKLPDIETLHTQSYKDFEVQQKINADAEEYLKSTDKWVIRFLETGKAVPSGITAQRAARRLEVQE